MVPPAGSTFRPLLHIRKSKIFLLSKDVQEFKGQGSKVCKLCCHSSKANFVPVLTLSVSGVRTGTRVTKAVRGTKASLRAPSADT